MTPPLPRSSHVSTQISHVSQTLAENSSAKLHLRRLIRWRPKDILSTSADSVIRLPNASPRQSGQIDPTYIPESTLPSTSVLQISIMKPSTTHLTHPQLSEQGNAEQDSPLCALIKKPHKSVSYVQIAKVCFVRSQ